jgi:hypothetical protein
MSVRAQTIRGYLQSMHQLYLTDPAVKTTQSSGSNFSSASSCPISPWPLAISF